jgi:hypothetical protein
MNSRESPLPNTPENDSIAAGALLHGEKALGVIGAGTAPHPAMPGKNEHHADPISQTELWVSERVFRVIRLKYPGFNPDLDNNSEKISLIFNHPTIKALQKDVANTALFSDKELFFIIDKVVARVLENQK